MKRILLLFLVLSLCSAAFAQKVDLAVLGGGQASFNPNSNVGTGAAIQGNFGYRLLHVPFVSLYGEIPITATFGINSELPTAIASRDFTTLFVTPGVRLKITPPVFPVQPYFTFGYGWARYTPEGSAVSSRSNTTDVVQFGVGSDFRVFPHLALRTEVRDYYTGPPRIDSTFTDRQHNLTFMGGLVLRF